MVWISKVDALALCDKLAKKERDNPERGPNLSKAQEAKIETAELLKSQLDALKEYPEPSLPPPPPPEGGDV